MNSTRLIEIIRGRSAMVRRRLAGRWATERILRRRFTDVTGRELDLDNASTMTEKLFRQMILIDRAKDSTWTPLVDKCLAREFIIERVGAEHVVPLYWQGKRPADIPFDDLPLPFVLKANHTSGSVCVVDADSDRDLVRRRARVWLRENYYWFGREYQYYPIDTMLLAEEFLDDGHDGGPLDYRFWCFHGEPHYIQVDNHDHDINPYYDTDWNLQEVTHRRGTRPFDLPRPAELSTMLEIARAISAGFEFIRVDLYLVRGQVYVGELTFTPAAGKLDFEPREWDARLGALWT